MDEHAIVTRNITFLFFSLGTTSTGYFLTCESQVGCVVDYRAQQSLDWEPAVKPERLVHPSDTLVGICSSLQVEYDRYFVTALSDRSWG